MCSKTCPHLDCVSVSVTELLATASQRHVIPLQGRPYESDQVTGMLTVEFQFKVSPGAPASNSVSTRPQSMVSEVSGEMRGMNHSDCKTVVNKPLGIMKNSTTSFSDNSADPSDYNSSLNRADLKKKGFSPYIDYNQQVTHQNIKEISWSFDIFI